MSFLGEFTGDKELAKSYNYGEHWRNKIGYKALKGNDNYKHKFGGNDWDISVCPNCNTPYHKIMSLDLRDPKLKSIMGICDKELPLISCLNCSSGWGEQFFKINFEEKKVELIKNTDTQHWIQDDELRIESPLCEVNMHLTSLNENENPINEDLYYELTDSFGEDYFVRVLGAPLYLQGPINRECPCCHKEMKYIATVGNDCGNMIDSINFDLGEMWLYFMFCNECSILKVESEGD